MLSSESSSSGTKDAMALAAASFISSVIWVARPSKAPLKMPGNATTLLTWLGKSLRPVPTTRAPAFFARSGMISGTGFAMANRMASLFMEATISSVTMPGAETPTKISAPFMASAREPVSFFGLVTSVIFCCIQFKPSVSLETIPTLSHTTTLQSSFFLPTTFKALMMPASTTIAVPCWSSWNTGMSRVAFNLSSISKQRGALMSSKLMPPKPGAK